MKALGLAIVCACLLLARTAAAHPAGFTSVNRYIGVSSDARGAVHLAYLIDFAELPAYAEIEELDADHDGQVSPAEQRAYLDRRVPPLVAQWTVEIDGVKVQPRVAGSSLEVPPGERGLSTLRIAADVVASPAAPVEGEAVRVRVVDPVFGDRSGWRELVAEESAETVVVSGLAGRAEDALAYGSGGPGGPPRVDEGRFVFRPRGAPEAIRQHADELPASRVPPSPPVDPRLAHLAQLMHDAEGRPSFALLALALAFALGAAHALSPGHGKALAAAYLVGRRARPSQALVFGTAVTVAHTAVVFLLGALALAVERTVGSDRLLRVLELAAAIAVLGLGIVQLSRRWRELMAGRPDHDHQPPPESADGTTSLVALGAASGLTPCPSALALLLAAVALHRYAFGLVVVLAFSAGVALTLTVAGLLVVMARRLLGTATPGSRTSAVLRWLPVMSSMCVLAIGVLLCASAWSPALTR